MKKLNLLSVVTLCAGVLCFIVKMATESFDATKSSITSEGYLHEPFFFLIPTGFILVITGIFLFLFKNIAGRFSSGQDSLNKE
ncbi:MULTISPECIES: DUF3955 domain-containing protein [Chryseobacterium]|jgi:TRAP-type mannitol/chloroaromatic compound transport system permease small subunit|uniref:TRAP-type mannitol/chloroaromatic compound transport system permease small subunit n=1 Tax=Chryseobacterium geocarposphaerae TaxID=1416776 RepID=A0ABU1LAP3_9FLAO|nr:MULTISPECIES: DUF3955 domain-containing protein [Chryseobacterium]MDR6403792.1 TRAP-type mannitol/chloroaromatic compound transport system permease small subunit [Chryseobacterium geocarposphaerae]MDR6697346.1 TRAP-type mannitol/chloroaromatic compound transport system permease small subunit [Chryseobacterium ginsenosidimutans]